MMPTPSVRERAVALGICDDVTDTAGAVRSLMPISSFCACPWGRWVRWPKQFADDLPTDAIVSDVGSCKQSVADALAAVLPGAIIIPAHPVAGTEKSGPDAGFATLFKGRWCILTPPEGAPEVAVERLGFSGSGWVPTLKSWMRGIMTWCSQSPAICRTLSPTPSSAPQMISKA